MHPIIPTILFLAQQTAAPQTAAPQTDLLQLMPFLFMGVIFYFLLIRPQQKQRKQLQLLIKNLKTGDRVVTSSGIHGLIANVKETTFSLKVADNVKIEIDKSAIVGVEKTAEPKPAASEAKPAA